MKTAYFWPIYGERDEIAFPFARTRGSAVVQEALKEYVGTLLSDGYRVYDTYTKTTNRIVHAQCWSHARRKYEEAESSDPTRVQEILERIAGIYVAEGALKSRMPTPEQVLAHRAEHVRPLVDGLFARLRGDSGRF
jgi:transposase